MTSFSKANHRATPRSQIGTSVFMNPLWIPHVSSWIQRSLIDPLSPRKTGPETCRRRISRSTGSDQFPLFRPCLWPQMVNLLFLGPLGMLRRVLAIVQFALAYGLGIGCLRCSCVADGFRIFESVTLKRVLTFRVFGVDDLTCSTPRQVFWSFDHDFRVCLAKPQKLRIHSSVFGRHT